ncbi:unnamed protein product [Polarella glacialis]|uniref:SET domain-containing protein n=1 Tax=Polarella glacialis TaxID=89957 RepID=A0A813HVT4_POLGL|nr:unnamed protein product [Polarella glacialis]
MASPSCDGSRLLGAARRDQRRLENGSEAEGATGLKSGPEVLRSLIADAPFVHPALARLPCRDPRRGRGVFASRSILCGERLLALPSLAAVDGVPEDQLFSALVEKCAAALREDNNSSCFAEAFWSLASSGASLDSGPELLPSSPDGTGTREAEGVPLPPAPRHGDDDSEENEEESGRSRADALGLGSRSTDTTPPPPTTTTSPPLKRRRLQETGILLLPKLEAGGKAVPRATLERVRRVVEINSHAWPRGEQKGLGLWPWQAYLNHTEPSEANCAEIFVGEVLVVRATRDIPADQEVLNSYSPPSAGYPLRRAILERCRVPTDELDARERE